MYRYFIFFVLAVTTFAASCGQTGKSPESKSRMKQPAVEVPLFNADSAYTYTAEQVAFGPRVPNTPAHVGCGNYLVSQLKRFGAAVFEQNVELTAYDGTLLKARNIIGSFQPENNNRIMLFAHWDSRPFSDRDPDPANYHTPIDGANDGAGACATLLEIARQIGQQQPAVGIDILFFDAEDWGVPDFDEKNQHISSWCLGSDFWARNPHKQNYTARYGILLDMVSAPNARFMKEGYSLQSAPDIVRKVWEAAQILGYGSYFVAANGSTIEDDHVHVIRHRRIPCIDIIQYDPETESGFGAYWHTQDDDMDHVSKKTLQATGQTVMYVIYHEKN